MSALSAAGATVVAPPFLKEANRGGARSAAGRSGPGPLCSRRLHVQFNVVKSGALERALVAAVAIECACPRHALIRADTGNDLDFADTPPVCVPPPTNAREPGREYVLCTRIPQATFARAEKTIDAALALLPDNSAAHEASGFLHFTKHQWAQAIAEEGRQSQPTPTTWLNGPPRAANSLRSGNKKASRHCFLGMHSARSKSGCSSLRPACRCARRACL